MTGDSGTPLPGKLGLKGGQRVAVLPDPSVYEALVPDRPEGPTPLGHLEPGLDPEADRKSIR